MVLIETIGMYPTIAYFTNYEYFEFTKDTNFERNYWLGNIYALVNIVFFVYYFVSLLNNEKTKKILYSINILFVIIGILNLFVSDIFFIGDAIYTNTVGTILLLFVVIVFYFDLLKSDKILNLKRYLPIYISIGVLVFNLIFAPLAIFSQYFLAINELFVNVKTTILLLANIFMYSLFILGFILCSKKKTT